MRKEGVEPSPKTYTTAINACSRTADWKRALLLLLEMRRAFPSRPSTAPVSTAVAKPSPPTLQSKQALRGGRGGGGAVAGVAAAAVGGRGRGMDTTSGRSHGSSSSSNKGRGRGDEGGDSTTGSTGGRVNGSGSGSSSSSSGGSGFTGPDWWGMGDLREAVGTASTATTPSSPPATATAASASAAAETIAVPTDRGAANTDEIGNRQQNPSAATAAVAAAGGFNVGGAKGSSSGGSGRSGRNNSSRGSSSGSRGGGGGESGKGGVDVRWTRAGGVAGRAAITDGRRAAYNAAINVCGRAGRWDRALGLLEVRRFDCFGVFSGVFRQCLCFFLAGEGRRGETTALPSYCATGDRALSLLGVRLFFS